MLNEAKMISGGTRRRMMTHLRTGAVFTAVLTMAAVSGVPEAGNAGARYHEADHGPVYRHVRAESFYSSRAVVAPVRRGPVGDQVMTPGGNWYDCEITCEYTLRRVYLDFWEDQRDKFTSPGFLRFEFVID
jgi:hypothetical protein